jgi:predicted DNA-binding protein YlxM (UPF0122 family)
MKQQTMTEVEAEWLRSLAAACDPTPPWTPAKSKARYTRDEYICDLYQKGVHVNDIAEKANLSKHAILAVVRKARKAGREVVRPRAKSAPREPFRRSLTEDEVATLRQLDAAVPRQRSGRRFLFGPAGEALLAEMVRLRGDKVALQPLADLLGVSRQAIHHMTKGRVWESPQSSLSA